MSAQVHTKLLTSLILCVILLMSALPSVVRSQEESVDVAETEENTSEEATVEVVNDFSTHPYKEEALLGDKVIGDFVLGPGKIELEIEPGQSKTVELTVSNRIGKPHVFTIDVEDMAGSNDPNRAVVLLGDDTGPYTLKDYISVPQAKFTLDHNRRARIPVTVSVPPDAEPGGLYGSVLVKTVTTEANIDEENPTVPASAIVSRIGTLFFVTVPGETNPEGKLLDFDLKSDKNWFDKGPIDFVITYENTGSLHLNPYGEIRITNMFGDEVGFSEVDPWFTLPGSLRTREISWNRESLYGRYEAKLQINRGYDDLVDESSLVFWVIPWKLVLMGAGAIFVVIFLIRAFFRTFEFKRKT